MTKLSTIGQIAMVVKDLSRAVAFYRDVLGMKFLFQSENREQLRKLGYDHETVYDRVLDKLIAKYGRPEGFTRRGKVVARLNPPGKIRDALRPEAVGADARARRAAAGGAGRIGLA